MGVERTSIHFNIVIFQRGEKEVEDENGHNIFYPKTFLKNTEVQKMNARKLILGMAAICIDILEISIYQGRYIDIEVYDLYRFSHYVQ